jgi:hypothetical protein
MEALKERLHVTLDRRVAARGSERYLQKPVIHRANLYLHLNTLVAARDTRESGHTPNGGRL